jgi:hypothetical protein
MTFFIWLGCEEEGARAEEKPEIAFILSIFKPTLFTCCVTESYAGTKLKIIYPSHKDMTWYGMTFVYWRSDMQLQSKPIPYNGSCPCPKSHCGHRLRSPIM